MTLKSGHIFALLSLQVFLVTGEWNASCPGICTCHDGYFSELPLATMIHSQHSHNHKQEEKQSLSYKERNEVLYEEDTAHVKYNPQLRMAVCILQPQTEVKEVFDQLQDVEALTILQSSDAINITLKADDFKLLNHLIVLEIHGIDHSKFRHNSNKSGKIRLRHDALKPLRSLQYINLQHIHLLGNPQQGNRIPPVSSQDYINQKYEPNELSSMLQPQIEQKINNRFKVKNKPLAQLVFLKPDENDQVLPYKVYQEEQEKLGVYSFSGLNDLKFLRVYYCNLCEINWEMFDGLQNLETLSLEGNDLLFLPDFAFYRTPSLKSLSLARNKLLSLHSMSLAGLLQLQHLDLTYNNITHFSELSLPPLPKLHSANFEHNPVEIIFPSTFEIMNATHELHLGSKEAVLDIQPNSFYGLRSLNKLSIMNIDLEILEREYLRGMPKLKDLKMDGHIREIAFDAFLDVSKLEKLVLKNCSIEKLSMDSFYGLYDMVSLDLSYNLLTDLPPGLFDQQFSLKELSLHRNHLVELPIGLFANLPAKMIRLDSNPWHCTCAMNDWQPAVINRIKQRVTNNNMCHFQFDKGSMCSLTEGVEYVYDKKVAPRCSSPPKYKGWSVFHLLRKELRCHNKEKYDKYKKKQKWLEFKKMKEAEKYKYTYMNKDNKYEKIKILGIYNNTPIKNNSGVTHKNVTKIENNLNISVQMNKTDTNKTASEKLPQIEILDKNKNITVSSKNINYIVPENKDSNENINATKINKNTGLEQNELQMVHYNSVRNYEMNKTLHLNVTENNKNLKSSHVEMSEENDNIIRTRKVITTESSPIENRVTGIDEITTPINNRDIVIENLNLKKFYTDRNEMNTDKGPETSATGLEEMAPSEQKPVQDNLKVYKTIQSDGKSTHNINKEQSIKYKEKLKHLQMKEERLMEKEKLRNIEVIRAKEFKKIYQRELERKHKEKLKLIHKY